MLRKFLEASYVEWLWLILAITTLTWVIFRIRSWIREADGPAGLSDELLMQFREMQRDGDLSEEEYRLIKGRLIEEEHVSHGTRKDCEP